MKRKRIVDYPVVSGGELLARVSLQASHQIETLNKLGAIKSKIIPASASLVLAGPGSSSGDIRRGMNKLGSLLVKDLIKCRPSLKAVGQFIDVLSEGGLVISIPLDNVQWVPEVDGAIPGTVPDDLAKRVILRSNPLFKGVEKYLRLLQRKCISSGIPIVINTSYLIQETLESQVKYLVSQETSQSEPGVPVARIFLAVVRIYFYVKEISIPPAMFTIEHVPRQLEGNIPHGSWGDLSLEEKQRLIKESIQDFVLHRCPIYSGVPSTNQSEILLGIPGCRITQMGSLGVGVKIPINAPDLVFQFRDSTSAYEILPEIQQVILTLTRKVSYPVSIRMIPEVEMV